MLKTPYYLALLPDVRRAYPDARVIQMHRDPAEVLASSSSVHAKTFGEPQVTTPRGDAVPAVWPCMVHVRHSKLWSGPVNNHRASGQPPETPTSPSLLT